MIGCSERSPIVEGLQVQPQACDLGIGTAKPPVGCLNKAVVLQQGRMGMPSRLVQQPDDLPDQGIVIRTMLGENLTGNGLVCLPIPKLPVRARRA